MELKLYFGEWMGKMSTIIKSQNFKYCYKRDGFSKGLFESFKYTKHQSSFFKTIKPIC